MSVVLVKYADQLQFTSPTGWSPRFDSLGTYQPTVGNLVVFCFTDTTVPTAMESLEPPWQPGSPFITCKVWAGTDSTTAVLAPSTQGAYVAYEFSGVDPTRVAGSFAIDAYQTHSETFGTIDSGRQAVFGPVTASDDTWYAFTHFTSASGIDHPLPTPPTYTNGFVYDGFSDWAGGTILTSHGGIQPAGTVTTTATVGGEWISEDWVGYLLLLGPTPPTPNSARITQTLVEMLVIPGPGGFTINGGDTGDEAFVYQREAFTF